MSKRDIHDLTHNEVGKIGNMLSEELGKLRNCTHEWREYGWKRVKDVRILKCGICGKIKKENTRIKKPKQR